MIIAYPFFSIKRMSETLCKSYAERNKVYKSCNGVEPSVKIKVRNAVKALDLAIVTEITRPINEIRLRNCKE